MLGHIYFLGSLTGLALLPIVDEAHGYALLLAVVLGGALVATIKAGGSGARIPSDRLEADRGRGTGMRRNGVPKWKSAPALDESEALLPGFARDGCQTARRVQSTAGGGGQQ